MKKRIIFLTLLALIFTTLFTSCFSGNKEVTKLTVVDGTFKYSYTVGENVDLSNIKVQADYNDGSSKILSYTDLDISKIDTSTVGTKPVTITYSGITLTIDVKVENAVVDEKPAATLSSISIDTSSVATRVIKGDAYSTAGIKVIATYSDNTIKEIPASDLTIGTIDTAAAGSKTLTVTYGGKTAELQVNVVEVTALQVIGVGTNGVTVMQGATIDTSALTAYATYSDNQVEAVANAALTFNIPATTEAGSFALKVAYRGCEASIPVTVKAPAGVIGIEVDYNSIKNYTVVADGVALDIDAILENIVVVAVYGYVNGASTEIERKEVVTDKNALTITETNGNERFITVSYSGYSKDITISETAATVTAIKIVEYNKGVKIGKVYDNSAIKINVTYSNGATEDVSFGSAGLTANVIDTAVAGENTLTVSFGGFSDSATVTVYGVTSIVPVGTVAPVVIDAELVYANLQLLVTYGDGESENIPVSAVTVGDINTAVAGNKTFTVTYYGVEGAVNYTVIGVNSVSINAGLNTNYKVGDVFSYANISITITYTDGSTKTFINASEAEKAGIVFNTDAINSAAIGEYDFTVSYKGVTSAAVKISFKEVEYEIFGVSEPKSLSILGTNKKYYLNGSYGYLVGDDNPFKYSLIISAYNFNGDKVSVNKYVSKSQVYLLEGETILNSKETLLEGAELDKYVTIDEINNSFDFTEAAIGKNFKIATRPAYGITVDDESEYAEYTRTHTFTVVDAYNVYDAVGLHVITNSDDFHDEGVMLSWAQNMLINAGYEVPNYEIKGVVLHNDIKITAKDLPAEFFAADGTLIDYTSLFFRDIAKGDFTIHGNYFTIYSYEVPSIADTGNNNSHTQLFRFASSVYDSNFDYTENDLRIENLYILDNDPNDPLNADSARSRLGFIGIKIAHCEAVLDNVVAERYYITLMGEYDNTALNINESKLYNAWQNHIFLWSKHTLNDNNADSEPSANHSPLQCNITNSKITICGGPIIISQTASPEENRQKNSGADVNIDAATEIGTYVTADSTWFNAMGASSYVTPIVAMNQLMQNVGGSYVFTKAPDGSEGQFFNLVSVILPGGETMADILSGKDIDGTVTIGDKLLSNMDDDAAMVNAAKKAVVAVLMNQGIQQENAVGLLNDIPILQSSNGGFACILQDASGFVFVELSSVMNMLAGEIVVPAFAPEQGGGYVTIYYKGMALLLDNFDPIG